MDVENLNHVKSGELLKQVEEFGYWYGKNGKKNYNFLFNTQANCTWQFLG